MGKGIDLARDLAPEHAAVLDDLKDQLLIAFVQRLGGKVSIPVAAIDNTGGYVLAFSVDEAKNFNFVLQQKQ